MSRYALFDQIASGGMATVHVGRLLGPAGFARTVAIKRMHPHLAGMTDFVAMFTDEARLAARVRHGNVVPVLDIVARDGELFLVMEYVQGESLATLLRLSKGRVDPAIACAIAVSVLDGLQAAHEAKSDQGTPLGIVHRDVTPQNVLLGVDGIARLMDFGIAKAVVRLHETRDEAVKGKLGYTAPEQLLREPVDRRADIYSAAVVFWEMLVGERLHGNDDAAAIVYATLEQPILPPSALASGIPAALDAVVMKGLQRKVEDRFATAKEMAHAIESAVRPATPREVAQWVERVGAAQLAERAQLVARIERTPLGSYDLEESPRSSDRAAGHVALQEVGREEGPSSAALPPGSLETDAVQKPRRMRAWMVVAAVAGLVLAASAVAAVLRSAMEQRDTRTPSPLTSASATGAVSSASPAPSAAPEPATALSSAPPPSVPSATGVPVQAGSPPGRPASVVRKRQSPPPSTASVKPSPAPSAQPNCESPFFIDSTGLRRPRPECFPR